MKPLRQQSYNEWLVIRCQQGETEAFERLLDDWRQRYFLYALNRLREREAAQDVTQDCLLSISRSIYKLSDPAAYPKWSFQILERRCVDWLRKRIRERKVIEIEKVDMQVLQDEQLFLSAESVDSKLTVGQLLENLDPRLATLVRLYYLEALSVEEIAEITGVPTGTVKSRLFYTRKLLSQLVNK